MVSVLNIKETMSDFFNKLIQCKATVMNKPTIRGIIVFIDKKLEEYFGNSLCYVRSLHFLRRPYMSIVDKW